MRKLLTTALFLIGAVALTSAPALAADCVSGLTIDNSTVACTFGGKTFDDWSVQITDLDFVSIRANFSQVGSTVFVQFIIVHFPSPAGPADLLVKYSVAGANINGVDIGLNTSANVTVIESVCANTFCGGAGAVSLANLLVSSNGNTADEAFFDPQSKIFISKDIQFASFNDSAISDFTNSHHMAVPEPATLLLLGSGLLGIGLLSRRRR